MHRRVIHWSSDSFHNYPSFNDQDSRFTIQHSRLVNLLLHRKVDLQFNCVYNSNAVKDYDRPFLGHNRSQTVALTMLETHVPLESVWSELLKEDQSCHSNLWKATNYDVNQIWPSRKPVSNYILKTVIAFFLEKHRIRDKYVNKYFYTYRIYQITCTLLRNVQSKSADCCCFHRHIENEATTMQRNRSGDTAWWTIIFIVIPLLLGHLDEIKKLHCKEMNNGCN